MPHVRFARYRVRIPASPMARIAAGVLLIIAGFFGVLPILGFWMIPAGLVLLSFDFPLVRRWRRRSEVFVLRRYRAWRRRRER